MDYCIFFNVKQAMYILEIIICVQKIILLMLELGWRKA